MRRAADADPRAARFVSRDDSAQTTYADGSIRREGVSGAFELISTDGRNRVLSAPDDSFSWYEDGVVAAEWRRNPSGGALSGRFRGVAFALDPGELARLDIGGGRLLILSGTGDEPVVNGWMEADGSLTRRIPGLGVAKRWMYDGRLHHDLLLEPGALASIARDDAGFDRAPAWALETGRGRLLSGFLAAYAACFDGFRLALAGAQGWGIERAYLHDGRLHVSLSAPAARSTLIVETGADTVTAYYFSGAALLKHVYTPDSRFETFTRTPAAEIRFRPSETHELRNGAWERTAVTPADPPPAPSWVRDAASAGGEVASHAFSIPQSALYGLEGLLSSGVGLLGGDAGLAGKVSSVYSLRQAQLNRYAGQGISSQEDILDTYRTALASLDARQRVRFVAAVAAQVEKQRREHHGELWPLHRDDPVAEEDLAAGAAAMFGLQNAAGQWQEKGREDFERGRRLAGAASYAAAAGAVAGEGWLTGLGFGAAAAPLKASAAARVSRLTGLLADAGHSGAIPFRSAQSALRALDTAEATVFAAPALVSAGYAGVDLLRAGDRDASWRAGDELFVAVAGMADLRGLSQARGLGGRLLRGSHDYNAPTARYSDMATGDLASPPAKAYARLLERAAEPEKLGAAEAYDLAVRLREHEGLGGGRSADTAVRALLDRATDQDWTVKARSLVVGGVGLPAAGPYAGGPFVRAGEMSLNTDPAARPDVLGDILVTRFPDRSFERVRFERVPFTAFSLNRAGALGEAARILAPGGRIEIETGILMPVEQVMREMPAAGFKDVQLTLMQPGGWSVSGVRGVTPPRRPGPWSLESNPSRAELSEFLRRKGITSEAGFVADLLLHGAGHKTRVQDAALASRLADLAADPELVAFEAARGVRLAWPHAPTPLLARPPPAIERLNRAAHSLDTVRLIADNQDALLRGAHRRQGAFRRHSAGWPSASLKAAVLKNTGGRYRKFVSSTGKLIYQSLDTGRQVVVDAAGYFRVYEPPSAGHPGGRYLAADGSVPVRVTRAEGGGVREVPLDGGELQRATHFLISDPESSARMDSGGAL